ncbi:MAG: helix-turn-helix transcriptional regulator [Muribaculaceae bacterium]
MIVTKDTKLHDVVINEPAIIAVLSRFGITLGIGDNTVRLICDERGIDAAFFVAVLNAFINEEYSGNDVFPACKAHSQEFLRLTGDYYSRFLIPNVEQHFNLLIRRNNAVNSNLQLMRNFFNEVKTDILAAVSGEAAFAPCCAVEEKLDDLVNMFVIHLSGNYDVNLCQAVLFAIIGLKKDINLYNRICNSLK